MKIRLIAVGTRAPGWVGDGFEMYAGRLRNALELVEIAAYPRRHAGAEAARREAERILERVGPRDTVVALDEHGLRWTTADLAAQIQMWRGSGRDVALLVGGPDGLGAACRERADTIWSLSPLTLPHALVRVVVAEQLYRAFSMLNHHPYHRE